MAITGISGLRKPLQWLLDLFNGRESESGIPINGETALRYAPVWYAVNRICGHVGQLPLTVHRRMERGAEKALDHPSYRLMRTRPNAYQSAVDFKEQLTFHALMWGNGRAAVIDEGGRRELIPLMPDRSITLMVEGEKWHATKPNRDDRIELISDMKKDPTGVVVLPDSQVLHIMGISSDGVSGKSLIDCARDSWGVGLASERHIGKHFKNGFSGSLMLEAPMGSFRQEKEAKEFLDHFNTHHAKDENKGKAGLLRDGVKANVLTLSGRDAQWIEQRTFQRQETALWFALESILGDDSSVSYNSLAEKHLAYLSNCLMRWLVKWEVECNEKLLTERERELDSHFFKFNVAALLRADFKTTVEALQIAVAARLLNPNEAREKLDLNPYVGGDTYENPAITPGRSGNTQDEEPENTAVTARIRHLVQVEANRVKQGSKSKNFMVWLDRFYDHWTDKLSSCIEDLGGDPSIAIDHCQESKETLLDLAGDCQPEELQEAIEAAVSTWGDRADSLIQSMEIARV